ncbi:MAG: BatD family protein, partial [Gammaproteobacteria bacterium]|nr:BatD family protein [Gammaproteobacteria bacterium]
IADAVAPLTDDTRTIENLLSALRPDMMPVLGSDLASGLEQAHRLLGNAGMRQGRILVVTDGVDDAAAVSEYRNHNFPISILGVGTPGGATIPLDFLNQRGQVLRSQQGDPIIARLDEARLRTTAQLHHGRYRTLTLASDDIDHLLTTPLPGDDETVEVERDFDTWADMGFWVAVALIPFALATFRRGAVALVPLLLLPGPAEAGLWEDLWQRRDQQGYEALREGAPEAAAALFETDDWRAAALYRSGEFDLAAQAYRRQTESTAALYNLGNALARQGRLQAAIDAYDRVLERDADHEDARFNKALVEEMLEEQSQGQQDEQSRQQEGGGEQPEDSAPPQDEANPEQDGENDAEAQPQPDGADGDPDEAQRSEPGETSQDASEEQLAASRDEQRDALEQWLRRVPDDPGGLLRRKFQYETNQRLRARRLPQPGDGEDLVIRPAADVSRQTRPWLAIMLVWLAMPAAAELRTTLEPRIIDELDTARLTIRASGSNEAQSLDLEALEADFEVLTTQTSSQYRSVNGQVQSWVEYQITLRPRRSGELTVPAITVGAETTEPVRLRVRGLDPELREAIERMVFFESELSTDPVYVQAQTVLTRRLYYSSGAQIYSDLPGLPEIADAIVTPLGETTSSTTIRDGRRYGVIEQRFAILPERSGELTIPAISITSSVRLQLDGRTRRSGVRIATDPMTVEVLPIPATYPADHPWLPAEALELTERWSPPNTAVEVGDPLTRTLTARIRGNVSSAIPPLTPVLPAQNFRRYPEPPDLEDDTSGSSVRGRREERYAVIPTAPGDLRLPPTEVVWFDVNAREVRTASTPGRGMSIRGSAVSTPADADNQSAGGDAPAGNTEPAEAGEQSTQWPAPASSFWWWLAATVTLLAAALLMTFGPLSMPRVAARALARRRAWRTLKSTCRGGGPVTMQRALQAYLQTHYGTSEADARRRFRHDGYAGILDGLNAARYGDDPGAISGNSAPAPWPMLRRRSQARQRQREILPALYD